MVSTVTATTDTTAAAAAMKQSLGMNKDDFMKLFIAQLQYQDPLAPQDPSAMLDQLSQLSLVEQSYNSNTALNNLLTAQNNSISLTAVSFIGKDVKAYGNSVSFDGSASTELAFSLPLSASSTQVSVVNSSGQTVRTAALGSSSAGENSFTWDGRDGSGALLPAGTYTFAVTAKTADGSALAATTYTTGRIDGVNLSGSIPQLAVGNISVALGDVISLGA
ncbi:MAG: flagellar hook assembly protein FlgD [Desulfuromonadaceae bacterium]|nr:flagellar hook assembly protein FlgD [Desulfuromonadaceae bacterium]MDD2847121.1 flagellar hook assembly protein FlgD [Desulfuromonadaceae bacterium]MDD4130065.1 flagellar hook assembly protein FlgD [Desulfuromonadaceae bacterium]